MSTYIERVLEHTALIALYKKRIAVLDQLVGEFEDDPFAFDYISQSRLKAVIQTLLLLIWELEKKEVIDDR